jgi:membrane associated rhomboid family serine protease
MQSIGIATLVLIVANCAFSIKGLRDYLFFDRYAFDIDAILGEKDYKRLFTGGFLHANWAHMFFNMITLYLFGNAIESAIGPVRYLTVYGVGLLGGSLASLYIHRQHSGFRSVGASGAICAVLFSAIGLFPGLRIMYYLLPIPIPGWIYGSLYVIYSIYGIQSQRDNIGHGAHLGGAVTGLILTLIMYPRILVVNYIPISLMLVPSLVFLFLLLRRPDLLIIDPASRMRDRYYSFEHRDNVQRRERESELNHILDKISAQGIESLTKEERRRLDTLSRDQGFR